MSIDLSREKDPEILRQAALLLEAENKRLVAQVMDLTRRLLEAEGKERVALQLEIQALQAQLATRNRALFGESSEQRKGETAAEPKAPKKPKTGHGPTKQQNLRIVEESIELPADERVCIMCRGSLEEMGEVETSEEVDVVAREFVMKRYVRKKYTAAAAVTASRPRRYRRVSSPADGTASPSPSTLRSRSTRITSRSNAR